jgi:hypothetical protein
MTPLTACWHSYEGETPRPGVIIPTVSPHNAGRTSISKIKTKHLITEDWCSSVDLHSSYVNRADLLSDLMKTRQRL